MHSILFNLLPIMKKNIPSILTFVLLFGFSHVHAEILLAGWQDFDNVGSSHTESADIVSTGFTATLQTGDMGSGVSGGLQSNDRVAGNSGPTFGTDTVDSGLKVNVSNANKTVTFTLANNTGSSYDLDYFYYDYKKTANANGTSDTTDWGDINLIAVSGITGATDGSVLNSQAVGTPNFTWKDIDVSLSGYSIGIGATAVLSLELDFDGTTATSDPTWHKSATIDNIAVTGTAVPEPQSYSLIIGFLVFSWVIVRARKS